MVVKPSDKSGGKNPTQGGIGKITPQGDYALPKFMAVRICQRNIYLARSLTDDIFSLTHILFLKIFLSTLKQFHLEAKLGIQLNPANIVAKQDVIDAYQTMKRSVVYEKMVKADDTCGPFVEDELTDTYIHYVGQMVCLKVGNEARYTFVCDTKIKQEFNRKCLGKKVLSEI